MKFKDLKVGELYAYCSKNSYPDLYTMTYHTSKVEILSLDKYREWKSFYYYRKDDSERFRIDDKGTLIKVRVHPKGESGKFREEYVPLNALRRSWEEHQKDLEESTASDIEYKRIRAEKAESNARTYGEAIAKFYEFCGDIYKAKNIRDQLKDGVTESGSWRIDVWNESTKDFRIPLEKILELVNLIEGK